MPKYVPDAESYDCAKIGQRVTVSIERVFVDTQAVANMELGKFMAGCTGNAVCKTFPPVRAVFKTVGPYPCPYHASLNKGSG